MPGGTHKFGGTWTELKLDVIAGYLGFYTTVLKHKPTPDGPFKLWYVDAFAGSGSRTVEITSGGMFEETPLRAEELEVAGSARRALEVDPPFHRL
ncbi:three-Cys-motif partner protein TcmP [Sphingomonas sp. G-3-2-10]|nr:three-Cys-motif partner protein TcmP [Sphingomonas sp. G-3-2-10]